MLWLIWTLLYLVGLCIVVTLLLRVVAAALALPIFAGWQPYTNLIYAIVVLLVAILVFTAIFSGDLGSWPGLADAPFRRGLR